MSNEVTELRFEHCGSNLFETVPNLEAVLGLLIKRAKEARDASLLDLRRQLETVILNLCSAYVRNRGSSLYGFDVLRKSWVSNDELDELLGHLTLRAKARHTLN